MSIATKEDIAELRSATQAELKAEIGELRAEMKADIAELRADLQKLRADMTWRMVLIMGAMLGLFTALDRLFLS